MINEQIYEHIVEKLNKMVDKHPELAMNKQAFIDGMLEQVKREGAMEVIEIIEEYLLNQCNEANDCDRRMKIKGNREKFYEGAHFYLKSAVQVVAALKKKYEV